MDSFRPALSFDRRQDDMKMVLLRLVSAVAIIFFVIQLAKEPENLDGLTSFTNESMNDFFNWGNDKFVLGQLADKSGGGNSTLKRRKSPQEVFMEAILDDPEDFGHPINDEPAVVEEVESKPLSDEDLDGPIFDRDTIGGTDEEDEEPSTGATTNEL